MTKYLNVTFLGHNVSIPVENEYGEFPWGYDERYDMPSGKESDYARFELPYGFTWEMRYWMPRDSIDNARSIIRDKNGDIISTYVEPYCDYEKTFLVELMKESFNNFEDDLKKKIDEARRVLSLHTNNG